MTSQPEFTWRQLLDVRSAELFPITDMRTAKRVGGVFWLCGAAVVLLLLPLSPPDQSSLGEWGWVVAAAIVLGAIAYGVRLLRAGSPASGVSVDPREILAFDYLAVVFIVVLNLLNGDEAPYGELMLLSAIFTAGVFSPRATATYMVAVAVALAVSAIGADGQGVAEQVARWVIWTGIAMAASMLIVKQRLERAVLLERGEEAQSLARADQLTGLGNRRAFNEAFRAASARASRTQRSLSVIVADVEAFKAVNDVFGLDAGDRLLQDVAAALDAAVRAPDSCFRWGGDEFVVLADIDVHGAAELGRRLSEEIRHTCVRPDGGPVRLHVGVAGLAPGSSNPEQILGLASRTMKPAPRPRG
jgi:diguanylate cyclase (GGDEF)-like protein